MSNVHCCNVYMSVMHVKKKQKREKDSKILSSKNNVKKQTI